MLSALLRIGAELASPPRPPKILRLTRQIRLAPRADRKRKFFPQKESPLAIFPLGFRYEKDERSLRDLNLREIRGDAQEEARLPDRQAQRIRPAQKFY